MMLVFSYFYAHWHRVVASIFNLAPADGSPLLPHHVPTDDPERSPSMTWKPATLDFVVNWLVSVGVL
jgi:hypothetical protein